MEEASCEICQEKYQMRWQLAKRCVSRRLVFQNFGKCMFVPVFGFLEILLVFLAVMIIDRLDESSTTKSRTISYILLGYILICLIGLLIIIGLAINHFYLETEVRNLLIFDYKESNLSEDQSKTDTLSDLKHL